MCRAKLDLSDVCSRVLSMGSRSPRLKPRDQHGYGCLNVVAQHDLTMPALLTSQRNQPTAVSKPREWELRLVVLVCQRHLGGISVRVCRLRRA